MSNSKYCDKCDRLVTVKVKSFSVVAGNPDAGNMHLCRHHMQTENTFRSERNESLHPQDRQPMLRWDEGKEV